ncbi:hypothetical protein NC981_10630 [Leptolyngbya sp. DQ-M1]
MNNGAEATQSQRETTQAQPEVKAFSLEQHQKQLQTIEFQTYAKSV